MLQSAKLLINAHLRHKGAIFATFIALFFSTWSLLDSKRSRILDLDLVLKTGVLTYSPGSSNEAPAKFDFAKKLAEFEELAILAFFASNFPNSEKLTDEQKSRAAPELELFKKTLGEILVELPVSLEIESKGGQDTTITEVRTALYVLTDEGPSLLTPIQTKVLNQPLPAGAPTKINIDPEFTMKGVPGPLFTAEYMELQVQKSSTIERKRIFHTFRQAVTESGQPLDVAVARRIQEGVAPFLLIVAMDGIRGEYIEATIELFPSTRSASLQKPTSDFIHTSKIDTVEELKNVTRWALIFVTVNLLLLMIPLFLYKDPKLPIARKCGAIYATAVLGILLAVSGSLIEYFFLLGFNTDSMKSLFQASAGSAWVFVNGYSLIALYTLVITFVVSLGGTQKAVLTRAFLLGYSAYMLTDFWHAYVVSPEAPVHFFLARFVTNWIGTFLQVCILYSVYGFLCKRLRIRRREQLTPQSST